MISLVRLVCDIAGHGGYKSPIMTRTQRKTDPERYNQETPYAAVTTQGGTTGLNASPTSLVWKFTGVIWEWDAYLEVDNTHIGDISGRSAQSGSQTGTVGHIADIGVDGVNVALSKVFYGLCSGLDSDFCGGGHGREEAG